jgi:chemotaxis protein histidine kinase CheA
MPAAQPGQYSIAPRSQANGDRIFERCLRRSGWQRRRDNALLRKAGKGYVLGVASNHVFHSWGRQQAIAGTASAIAQSLPKKAWRRLPSGEGTKGPRWQAKAAAEAKAAEEVRLAAEKTKQIEAEKAAAAEWGRVAAEQAAAEKLATEKATAERKPAEEKAPAEKAALPKADAEKAAAERALAEKKAAQEALAPEKAATEKAADKQEAEMATNGKSDDAQKLASVTPQVDLTKPALSPSELTKLVQVELKRVGCLAGTADGDWNSASQRSLTLFNKYTKFDVKLASLDVLDARKTKPSRVCPLVCEHGFKVDGDRCVKIVCPMLIALITTTSVKGFRRKDRSQPALKAGEIHSASATTLSLVRQSRRHQGRLFARGKSADPSPGDAEWSRPYQRAGTGAEMKEVCN